MHARFAGKILISHFCTYENDGNRELILRGKALPLFFGRLLRKPLLELPLILFLKTIPFIPKS